MELIRHGVYHIYNQGNNRERIFYRRENYLFFLQRFRKYILPTTEVLAYCLMPNHFHFMIYATDQSVKETRVGGVVMSSVANGFRQLLSSYAQAINQQEKRSGSLFRQKTKATLLEGRDQPVICFRYIHQNPVKSGLARYADDWEFSSFRDYAGLRSGTLCQQSLAGDLLDISLDTIHLLE